MGRLANSLSKQYNLKDAAQFQKALADLNSNFDAKLQVSPTTTPVPTIDFANKSKTTTSGNEARLTYPTSANLSGTLSNILIQEFTTHPQIVGLINATLDIHGSSLIVTTPISEAVRIEQKEQTFLPNVMQNSWMKYATYHGRSIEQANNQVEIERAAEIQALTFLKV